MEIHRLFYVLLVIALIILNVLVAYGEEEIVVSTTGKKIHNSIKNILSQATGGLNKKKSSKSTSKAELAQG